VARGRIALSGVGLRPPIDRSAALDVSLLRERAERRDRPDASQGCGMSERHGTTRPVRRKIGALFVRLRARLRFTRRRLVPGLSAAAAMAGGLETVRAAQARYYDGPVSDHFDGVRFVDPHGPALKSFSDVMRMWSARGSRAPWEEWTPSPYADR